jgi:GMP synthase (glutamine-hydrolysing)
MLKLLLVEGNTAEGRRHHAAAGGAIAHELYAETLLGLRKELCFSAAFPADGEATLPDAAEIKAFDGIVWTGSALNIYKGGPAVERQIRFARECFHAGVPQFGSCWGLQVAVAASGGEVILNPKGREIGIARKIVQTAQGRTHPLYHKKPVVFDALAVHKDTVARLPRGAEVLAANDNSEFQAAAFFFDNGPFWGVQYHPEYTFGEVGACMTRYAASLVEEVLFETEAEVRATAREFASFDNGATKAARWRYGLDASVLDVAERRRELGNWLGFIHEKQIVS